MINKIFAAAILSAALSAGMTATATAGGGGGGGDDVASITMTNPDGSTVSARGKKDGSRTITHRDRNGKITKQTKTPPKRDARGKKKKGTSWAYSHTTKTLSVGVAKGVHVVISPVEIGEGR